MTLTPRQLDVLAAIRDYRDANGYAPTMAELGGRLGMSAVRVFEHVGALESKGVVRRDRRKHRSLEIVSDDWLPPRAFLRFPVLGDVVGETVVWGE